MKLSTLKSVSDHLRTKPLIKKSLLKRYLVLLLFSLIFNGCGVTSRIIHTPKESDYMKFWALLAVDTNNISFDAAKKDWSSILVVPMSYSSSFFGPSGSWKYDVKEQAEGNDKRDFENLYDGSLKTFRYFEIEGKSFSTISRMLEKKQQENERNSIFEDPEVQLAKFYHADIVFSYSINFIHSFSQYSGSTHYPVIKYSFYDVANGKLIISRQYSTVNYSVGLDARTKLFVDTFAHWKADNNKYNVKVAKNFIEKRPDDILGLSYLAYAAYEANDTETLKIASEKLMTLYPEHPNSYLRMASYRILTGESSEAIKICMDVASKTYSKIYLNRAIELLEKIQKKQNNETVANAISELQLRIKSKTPSVPRTVQIPSTSQTPSQEKQQILSIATGFMFGSSGYILTNYHVVRGAKSIKIKYHNGEKVTAEVIIKDSQNDIAFLKPKSIPNIRTINLSLADSSSVRLGDKVFTLGYPIANILGENLKYSEGVINSLSGVGDDPKVFQISIPTQHGNSGGPLFNQRYEVIGIVSSSLDEAKTQQVMGITPQNVNFAIKSSFVRNMLSMLPETLISPTNLSLVQNKSKQSISNFVQQVENNIVLIEVE